MAADVFPLASPQSSVSIREADVAVRLSRPTEQRSRTTRFEIGRVYKPGATSEIEDSPRVKRRRLPQR
jgi:hypothetical protein